MKVKSIELKEVPQVHITGYLKWQLVVTMDNGDELKTDYEVNRVTQEQFHQLCGDNYLLSLELHALSQCMSKMEPSLFVYKKRFNKTS